MAAMRPVVLSIAGYDPGSGAGVSADIKTIAAHGCFGISAVTAMTVQNTRGVRSVEPVSGRLMRATLAALADDFPIEHVRIGMLASAEVAGVVADFLEERTPKVVVLDPVIRSSSGAILLGEAGIPVLRERLLPLATLITPNIDEAAELVGAPVTTVAEMQTAAKSLHSLGARNVVITGGHLPQNVDLLLLESGEAHEIGGAKIESTSTHGTGCAFATSITCSMALGATLPDAVRKGKKYVENSVRSAYAIGKGSGPIHHLFDFDR
jgi:hydroxymethylpyrimidine/phosphomethylpyrimidine kinase